MPDAQPITTETIRNWVMDDGGLAEYHDPINGHLAAKHAGKMFDRWLAEHDAEVAKSAWDQGFGRGTSKAGSWLDNPYLNPLRESVGPTE